MSLENGQRRTLHKSGTFARFLARPQGRGYLLFVDGSTLFAAPLDPDRLSLDANPAAVVDAVAVTPGLGAGSAQFDVSRTGTLLYRTDAQGTDPVAMHWIDPMDKLRPLPATPGMYLQPRVSPNGANIALTVRSEGGQDIWVYDIRRDAMSRLTYTGGDSQFPVWTPDGRYIVFSSGQNGGGLRWIRSDGATGAQRLLQSEFGQFPWSFTPDGKRLAYAEFPRGGGSGDIWTVPIEADGAGLKAGKPEVFLKTEAERAVSGLLSRRPLDCLPIVGVRWEPDLRAFIPRRRWQMANLQHWRCRTNLVQQRT